MQRPAWFKCIPTTAAGAFVILAMAGCTVPSSVVRTAADDSLLHPVERLKVDDGPADAPLPVVKNNSEAGDAFLRTPARRIAPGDPGVSRLISRMRATVEAEQGVGVAAPQAGVSRRLILVKRLDKVPQGGDSAAAPLEACLNPVILDSSAEQVEDWEGCLSIPAGFGRVMRSVSITVACDRPDGGHDREMISGFTARIFQHEIDHLDGVLFIDRLSPGAQLVPKEAYRELRRKQREDEAASGRSAQPVPAPATPSAPSEPSAPTPPAGDHQP